MSPRSLPTFPLLALACATLGLGACGSGGDDDPDAAPVVADAGQPAGPMDVVPEGGASGDETDSSNGGNGDDGDAVGEGGGGGAGNEMDAPVPPGAPDGPTNPSDDPPVTEPVPETGEADAPLSGDASRIGVLAVSRGAGADVGSDAIVAAFFGLDTPIPAGDIGAELLPPPDTCTFGSGDDSAFDAVAIDPENLDDSGLTSLSAGENIVITGPAGTFATLQRIEAGGFVAYASEGDGAPIPADLVADIPGDEFPAFPTVTIPDAPALANVSPSDLASVDVDTTFSWQAGDDDSARVGVTLVVAGTDPVVSVSCSAADDGEFRLPASLRARLPDGQPAEASLTRVVTRTLQQGDAVLVVVGAGGVAR